VPGALAHLDCTLDRHIDAGDHVIVFGAAQRTCHRASATTPTAVTNPADRFF
jgi:flavin reductase (DIM6/NTAB) family NADH-FMN oxidoreductase RutF